jgi:hypothetical protein
MKCKCGYLNSGDICNLCGEVLREKEYVDTKPKKVSLSMAKKLKEYSRLKAEFLKKNPMCKVYKDKKATTIHHMKGRIGDLLLDTKYWIGVSMEAHDEIEKNPAWAKEKGYSLSRLENEQV